MKQHLLSTFVVCCAGLLATACKTPDGKRVFAANLPVEDFSAKYETTFCPQEAGEYVVNVEGTGHFELYTSPSTGGMQTAMVYLPFRAPEK